MALEEDKAAKVAQLYGVTRDRLNALTAPYAVFEQVAWALKLAEARSVLANAGHDGLLLPEATATLKFSGVAEPTAEQVYGQLYNMAQGIVTASDQLMAAESVLVGWRSATKNRIDQAENDAALSAISLQPPI